MDVRVEVMLGERNCFVVPECFQVIVVGGLVGLPSVLCSESLRVVTVAGWVNLHASKVRCRWLGLRKEFRWDVVFSGSFISWNSAFRAGAADDAREHPLLFVVGNVMGKDGEAQSTFAVRAFEINSVLHCILEWEQYFMQDVVKRTSYMFLVPESLSVLLSYS